MTHAAHWAESCVGGGVAGGLAGGEGGGGAGGHRERTGVLHGVGGAAWGSHGG